MPVRINNLRIVKINAYNYVIEEYREITAADDESKLKDWVQRRGYFSKIQSAAREIRRLLINKAAEQEDISSVNQLIKYLDAFEEIEVGYLEKDPKAKKDNPDESTEEEEEADF